jgi:ABC-type bacteriocin/lantibiotic exporter with double-glycine peptidase domain
MGEHGINTNVGNAGGQLSGGQKQQNCNSESIH